MVWTKVTFPEAKNWFIGTERNTQWRHRFFGINKGLDMWGKIFLDANFKKLALGDVTFLDANLIWRWKKFQNLALRRSGMSLWKKRDWKVEGMFNFGASKKMMNLRLLVFVLLGMTWAKTHSKSEVEQEGTRGSVVPHWKNKHCHK